MNSQIIFALFTQNRRSEMAKIKKIYGKIFPIQTKNAVGKNAMFTLRNVKRREKHQLNKYKNESV